MRSVRRRSWDHSSVSEPARAEAEIQAQADGTCCPPWSWCVHLGTDKPWVILLPSWTQIPQSMLSSPLPNAGAALSPACPVAQHWQHIQNTLIFWEENGCADLGIISRFLRSTNLGGKKEKSVHARSHARGLTGAPWFNQFSISNLLWELSIHSRRFWGKNGEQRRWRVISTGIQP